MRVAGALTPPGRVFVLAAESDAEDGRVIRRLAMISIRWHTMVERIRFQSGLPPLAATEGIQKTKPQRKDPHQKREKQTGRKRKRRAASAAEAVDAARQADAGPTESEQEPGMRKKMIDILV